MSPGWEAIRAEVLRRIRVREWPPGAVIPAEAALAAEFGVARATVNRALRELARAGMLERRRRAGTRVTALPVRKATLDIPVIRQEIEAGGHEHSFRLLTCQLLPLPPEISAQLSQAPGTPFWWMETLHLAGGRPFVLESRWLNPAVLPDPPPDFALVSVNEWLVAHIAYASGDIAFSAQAASPREAEVLGVPPGAALFITGRTTWSASAAITAVRLSHAPGYRVQTQL